MQSVGRSRRLGRRYVALERFAALARFSRVLWTAAAAPWRLSRDEIDVGTAAAVTSVALVMVGLACTALTGFTTTRIGTGSTLLLGAVAVVFESTSIGAAGHRRRGRLLVACSGPLIPGLMMLFAALAYLGLTGFWYPFWTSAPFRMVVVTILVAMPLWTVYVLVAARSRDGWLAAIGGPLAAVGAGLLALQLLVPDWAGVLRFLDRPLNVAPATDTMVFALRNYAGVSLEPGGRLWMTGAVLLAVGYALSLNSSWSRPQPDSGTDR